MQVKVQVADNLKQALKIKSMKQAEEGYKLRTGRGP
jgi:hypothetical protein